VDTLGLLHCVEIQAANIQDRDGAKSLLQKAKPFMGKLKKIWADGGYRGAVVDWVKQNLEWDLEIVRKPRQQKTFQVLPKRWIVERSLAWLNHYRLLDKEHELNQENSEADILAAFTHRMLRALGA
jgi:putative transposase